MVVTDVRVRGLFAHEHYKAFVSVTLDDAFVVHDIRVNESHGKIYIAMPAKRKNKGYHYDIAHPITSDLRREIEIAVKRAYIKAKSKL